MIDDAKAALLLEEVSRVSRKMRTLFDAKARSQGLTLARARLLLQLARADGPTQTELAERLEIEQPTLVRLLDGLEKIGLVCRRSVPGDRRARRVFLTEEARRQAGDILRFVEAMRSDILSGIDPAEVAVATRVLERVRQNIGAAA